jgi:UDP-2-acetamido-3-amino-2,3-dideoxy-glucuronate N-acetyltransferase
MKTISRALADEESDTVGDGAEIGQFAVVLSGAQIGAGCNIRPLVLIENDVIAGDRVTIKSCVRLWGGIRVMYDVFIGRHVAFAQVPPPQCGELARKPCGPVVETEASIKAGARILPGIIIKAGALVASGAVVTGNVASKSLLCSNPGRHVRFLGEREPHED